MHLEDIVLENLALRSALEEQKKLLAHAEEQIELWRANYDIARQFADIPNEGPPDSKPDPTLSHQLSSLFYSFDGFADEEEEPPCK